MHANNTQLRTDLRKIKSPRVLQRQVATKLWALFYLWVMLGEENGTRVIKVYMGNDLTILDESESTGKTPGEVQKVNIPTSKANMLTILQNRNQWSLFVRSSDPEFPRCVFSQFLIFLKTKENFRCISNVEFRFHPDWTTRGNHKSRLDSNIVKFNAPPFVFTNVRHYFVRN